MYSVPCTQYSLPCTQNLPFRIQLLRCLDQLGHDLEGITHDPVVRCFEERGFGVLVDHCDHLALVHSRKVLDRAADANGDVTVRTNGNTGLTHVCI